MVRCYNMGCKYCNDKYKCTNKNIVLNYKGINTRLQGYKELLECASYEESELSKKMKEILRKAGFYNE